MSMSGYARKTGDAQTAQVVTLLNQLGDRMVRSERERLAVREEIEETREILNALENRAEKTERIFLTIQDNISKKETVAEALLERQNALERLYRDSAERLKRAEAMTGQIEEALALQNRLARRLEKTAQDKMRILSKIEHIEAVVEETRRSLNSGALVGITVPQPPANDPLGQRPAAPAAWWKTSPAMRATTIAGLVVVGLLSGAAINQMMTHWPKIADRSVVATADISAPPAADSATDTYVSPYATRPVAPTATAVTSTDDNDLAAYGEDAMMDAMDSDPDAVAETLNALEPSIAATQDAEIVAPAQDADIVLPSSAAPEEGTPDQTQNDAAAPIAVPLAAAPVDTAAIDSFIRAQTPSGGTLRERITADTKLPASIKPVEQKAFDGVPEAQHDIAAIYTAGHGGVAVDYKRAAQWFTEASINGIANARYNLGVLYHQGLGVERDIARAIGWYRAAAALGHPEAEYNLGIAAIEGIGTAYDPRQAASSFEKAARGGVMEAAYNLGLIHENGLLGDPDMNEAVFWYSLAADHNPEARVALNHVMKALTLKSTDVDRIVREYGAVYNLTPGATPRRAEAVSTPALAPETAPTRVAALTPQDQETPQDTAALAGMIPPLTVDESRTLLNSVRKDQAVIAQIQEQLMRLGLYPGPADGLGGPQTEDAIRTYQSRHQLSVTGKPTEDLLVQMLASELDAAAGSASR